MTEPQQQTPPRTVEELGRLADELERTIADLTARATAGEIAGHTLSQQVQAVGHRLVSLRMGIMVLFDELERIHPVAPVQPKEGHT